MNETTIATLAAAFLGALIAMLSTAATNRHNQQREQLNQQREFLEKQVRELYSPISALHKMLLYRGELSAQIETATAHSRTPKQTEYERQEFSTVLLPAYEDMLKIFTNNLWLADPSTRRHYQAFVRYVEMLRRMVGDSVGPSLPPNIRFNTDRVVPVFEEIELKLTEKLALLQSGLLPSPKLTEAGDDVSDLFQNESMHRSKLDNDLPLPVATGMIGILITFIFSSKLTGGQGFLIGFAIGLVFLTSKTIYSYLIVRETKTYGELAGND